MTDGPLFQSHEMASSKNLIMKRIISSQEYIKLIEQAYNKKPSFEIIVDAISKFQNTLITPNSKFDKYLRGELQLNPQEKKGMDLFIGYGCVSCHNGINIGSNSFQQFGTVFTVDENSSSNNNNLTFLVPSLRNVEKTYPYFHDGSVKTLQEAIEIMGYHNVGIQLTDDEISAIESFLKTFTGEIPENFKDFK